MFVSRNFGFAWGLYMAAVVLWPGPAADDDIPVREALTARYSIQCVNSIRNLTRFEL